MGVPDHPGKGKFGGRPPPTKTRQTVSPVLPPGEYERSVGWTCFGDSAFCQITLVSVHYRKFPSSLNSTVAKRRRRLCLWVIRLLSARVLKIYERTWTKFCGFVKHCPGRKCLYFGVSLSFFVDSLPLKAILRSLYSAGGSTILGGNLRSLISGVVGQKRSRKFQFSDRGHHGCSKVTFWP